MTAASPTEVTPTPAAPALGGGNGVTPPSAPAGGTASPASWRDAIPEPLRADPHLSRFKDDPTGIAELAKEHVNLQSLIGKKGIIPPGKDAKPEEIQAFHRALGVPETPDKYDLGDFKPPEGLPWDETLIPKMLSHFHAAGIPNEAARKVIDGYAAEQAAAYAGALQQAETVREQGIDGLRREWGQAWDKRFAAANNALRNFSGQALEEVKKITLADGTPLVGNPQFIRMMAEAGMKLGEHALIGDPQRGMGITPAEAKVEIAKKMADDQFQVAYTTRGHPMHDEAVAEMKRLTEAAQGA